ncbi:rod shape-determining protein MreC [Polymorphobacter sp. PAMC 29334]|uniref:rod shape-determining protein MreC n=1 Tax=Polymorphobacter sp. PAMC 29334 TaxID=2862331 RepID=UPI001C754933|nr:rod shape-determining protein MreC [Polymorphobacter sp. PAMC 29334]QYE33955.1 rod shape-determining protein MreC [Polymorphobacter sp. PAMC 29334]
MDWPPPRRTSYARREQNLALIGAVVTGAVLATALLLLVLSRVNPAYTNRLRSGTADLVAPFWATVRAPFDWLGGGVDAIGEYIATVPRNRVLTAEVARDRLDLQSRDAAITENIALKKLLHVIEPRTEVVAVTRFAGASIGSYARTAMVAAGHANGVFAGQAVRADAGLVGRTVEAGEHAARILLLTDTNSRVPVIIVRTGQPALAVGAAGRLLEVHDRLGAEVPLKVGDRLVTSGAGGLFAPQIPVAVVTDTAEPPHALPYADPATLSYVAIVRAYLPIPAQAEAPPVDAVPVPREAKKH